MFRTGPDVPGLPEGDYRRALMHVEGRANKAKFRKGMKILERLAKTGFAPARERIEAMQRS